MRSFLPLHSKFEVKGSLGLGQALNSTLVFNPSSYHLCPSMVWDPPLWCSSWGKKHLLSSLQLHGLLLASLTTSQKKGTLALASTVPPDPHPEPLGARHPGDLLPYSPSVIRLAAGEPARPPPLNLTPRKDRDEGSDSD